VTISEITEKKVMYRDFRVTILHIALKFQYYIGLCFLPDRRSEREFRC